MTSNEPFSRCLTRIIETALAEDIGGGDITSQLTIPESVQGVMIFAARQELVACGTQIAVLVYERLGGGIVVEPGAGEGAYVAKGTALVTAKGSVRALLTGERVILNLMQHLSGIATLTKQYVDAVKGTKAVILDTRKTLPGLRELEKYAVRIGGGQNHRMRLDDMVLIKDNHLGIRREALGIREMIENIRKHLALMPNAQSPIPIIIECDTLEQVQEALAAKPDRIMLDNMSLDMLREAVALVAGRVPLEASGNVSLQTVRAIAETGVDYISVGKITHSAAAVDIGGDLKHL